MLADLKSVWPVIVRRDLDWKSYAVANVRNKAVSGPPVALSDLVRKDQFRIGVDATPKPKIAALVFGLYQPASMRADILPLLVHFDSHAWKITKVFVHVVCERLAGFTDNAPDSFLVCLEHAGHCSHRRPFTERRQN
jgi:hypothetical protein